MTDSDDTHTAAVTLGRKGGLKGGPARAIALTPAQRRKIASIAGKARWDRGPQPNLLLPCPFCKSGEFLRLESEPVLHMVVCDQCSAMGPMTKNVVSAINGWNGLL